MKSLVRMLEKIAREIDPEIEINERDSLSTSSYLSLYDPRTEEAVKLRLSDHRAQRPGTNLGTGVRYAKPDVDIWVGDDGSLNTDSCIVFRESDVLTKIVDRLGAELDRARWIRGKWRRQA